MPCGHRPTTWQPHCSLITFVLVTIVLTSSTSFASNPRQTIVQTPNLVALWDFSEAPGQARLAHNGLYALQERGSSPSTPTTVQRVGGGPISGYAAQLTGEEFFSLARAQSGALNITGSGKLTVIAWVKRQPKVGFTSANGNAENSAEFIAGMWNERDVTRQYGLYVNLPFYGGGNQVCGHVSVDGGPTPGYPFSRDYSANVTPVPTGQWSTIAFTYDGTWVKSYLNGVFEARPTFTDNLGHTYSKNPYYYPQGLYDGLGPKGGADFTVGAVTWDGFIHNRFVGLIGGVAVFDRALSDAEISSLTFNTPIPEPASLATLTLGAMWGMRRRARGIR